MEMIGPRQRWEQVSKPQTETRRQVVNDEDKGKRGSQVQVEMERQERAIAVADAALQLVHNRIESVMRPPAPADVGPEKTKDDSVVPLASWIRAQTRKIENLTAFVRYMAERIEL